MRISLFCACILGLLTLAACSERNDQDNTNRQPLLFERVDPALSGIDFTNEVVNTKEFNIFNYRNFYNGGGVGLGDLNNDGLTDVFLGANMGENKLYLNRGDWQFEDISTAAGITAPKQWSTGVAMVDINQDGWLDIYVCNAGFLPGGDQNNDLFINQQDGTFREAAAEYGLDDGGYTTHAAFADFDRDGDLDVYLLNNSFIPVNSLNLSNDRDRYAEDWQVKEFLKGGGDKYLRNDGGQFTDVTRQVGIFGSLIGFGLGVTVGDINGDLYPDIYVSNDFYERDYLYVNRGDGTFTEDLESYMRHLSLASMGADLADLNNDGHPELFATEMLPESDYRRKTTVQFETFNVNQIKQRRGFYHQYMHNTLQLNNGDGTFSEIAQHAGVEATDWSWGALLFDADNDGLRDLYVCNGIYHDLTNQDFIDFFANDVVQEMALTGQKQDIQQVIGEMPSEPLPNKFFRNTGSLEFQDVTASWGASPPSFSNGAAYGDLDNDGDLDLVVNNVNQPSMVFRNRAQELGHHYLKVQVRGPATNPFGVGAIIQTFVGGEQLTTHILPTRGFQSSVDYPVIQGLGERLAVDSLRVIWPDRYYQTLPSPAIDTVLTVTYADARQKLPAPVTSTRADNTARIFKPDSLALEAHREEDFADQLREGLLMRSLSREGPRAAVGDLNGDGADDMVVGGARNQPTQLYLQVDGQLVASDQPLFRQLSVVEDTEVTLFDADGDGDADLFLGTGGNFNRPNDSYIRDLLVFNDGTGNFSTRKGVLPNNGYNTAVAQPLDYDGDGDLDLFVGSRSVPGVYGVSPPSFLYQNNGAGQFTDVSAKVAPDFGDLGMVTDADWTGGVLTITQEWGGVAQYRYDGSVLRPIDNNLADAAGWWYAVQSVDLDGDGDQDLVLGNRGTNFYFEATVDRPAKLFVGDFDANGTVEKIVTHTLDGKDMPLFMKKELTNELVMLKKNSLRHDEYASKSIQELLGTRALNEAEISQATHFESAVAINDGRGKYELRALPVAAQLSVVTAIELADLNGDGATDLILGGNFSGYLPQFSRQDASYGLVLLNDGAGNFRPLKARDSGLRMVGDVKDLVRITVGGRTYLVALINDAAPAVFTISPTANSIQ